MAANVLSLTTADASSLDDGTLYKFLNSIQDENVSCLLALRGCSATQAETLRTHPHVVGVVEVSPMSLSRARNRLFDEFRRRGLHDAFDWVTFWDDDCFFPKLRDKLELVPDEYVIAIGSYGPTSSTVSDRFRIRRGEISVKDAYFIGSSATIYVRSTFFVSTEGFSEKLGAGTTISSGEDSEFLLRSRLKGATFFFEPDLFVHHEYKDRDKQKWRPANFILALRYRSAFPFLWIQWLRGMAQIMVRFRFETNLGQRLSYRDLKNLSKLLVGNLGDDALEFSDYEPDANNSK